MVETQPAPRPGDKIVGLEVIKDVQERYEYGMLEYGVPLQTFNGRDAFQEVYEEQLDQLVYMKQVILERDEEMRMLGEVRTLLTDNPAPEDIASSVLLIDAILERRLNR
jgi:hypothetical protein